MTDAERIEQIARECHAAYQREAKRHGDIRHPDDYERLSEGVKESNRVMARFIVKREAVLRRVVEAAQALTEDALFHPTSDGLEVCSGVLDDLKDALDRKGDPMTPHRCPVCDGRGEVHITEKETT